MISEKVSQDKSFNYWVGTSRFVKKHRELFVQYLGKHKPQFYDLQIDYIKYLDEQDVNRDRNQIFCAPTGSGKTLIFIMKILENLDRLDKANYCQFKCIYIAPTKSICQQQYQQFVKYLGQNSKYKLKIGCLFKDMQTQIDAYKQILVCTPEMMLNIFKKMYQDNVLKYINLFLIDEVHLIGCEKRGQYLQAMIKQAIDVKKIHNKLQISCMSASLPNIEDVAEWLDAKIIRNDKRQIPLEMVAYFHHSFDNIQQYGYRKNILIKLPNVIQQLQKAFQKDYTQNSIKNSSI